VTSFFPGRMKSLFIAGASLFLPSWVVFSFNIDLPQHLLPVLKFHLMCKYFFPLDFLSIGFLGCPSIFLAGMPFDIPLVLVFRASSFYPDNLKNKLKSSFRIGSRPPFSVFHWYVLPGPSSPLLFLVFNRRTSSALWETIFPYTCSRMRTGDLTEAGNLLDMSTSLKNRSS